MTEERKKLLIALAKKGDVAAFEELLKLHERKIHSFALSITGGDHAAAADIYQEAVIKAYLNIAKFKEKASFGTWLWKIVKNEFINYIKSPRTSSNVSFEDLPGVEPGMHESSERDFASEERKQNLRKLVSMLHVNYQEIITLIDFQELSYEEAADVLGVKTDAVRVRIHRARERLAELATEHEELFI